MGGALCCDHWDKSEVEAGEMDIRITVKFLRGESLISNFVFVCSREHDLGPGVDAAVTFFRRQHADVSLFDTSMTLSFERD
jgi:hypothetical protein